MRMSPDEPAAVVLERLRANPPKAPDPSRREHDPTYEGRLAAWNDAVAREQHWANQEAAGQERGPWPPA